MSDARRMFAVGALVVLNDKLSHDANLSDVTHEKSVNPGDICVIMGQAGRAGLYRVMFNDGTIGSVHEVYLNEVT